MSIGFEQPAWLWTLAALPIVLLLAAIRLRGEEPLRLGIILLVRGLLFALLIAALARPALVRTHRDLSVVALVDVSESVRRFGALGPQDASASAGASASIRAAREWLRDAAGKARPEDRLGVVVFDGRSAVVSVPRRGELLEDDLDRAMEEGTDIASAIRLGAALLPPDTLGRMVLISDGNQTVGDALAVAREVAAGSRGGLPIDVLPIPYLAGPDVRVARLEAPPAARPGQLVVLRAVLEATEPRRGRLELTREGEIIDLDPDGPGTGLAVDLPAGLSVHRLCAMVDDRPVQRFSVLFIPEGGPDSIPENDRADAIVTNPSAGAVLVLRGDAGGAPRPSPLDELIRSLNRTVVSGPPESMPQSLLELQSFDLVVLDNVSAAQLGPQGQELLATAVDRLGAGLIMGGGPNSFGAGGWLGTPVAPLLPVLMELPRALQQPRAALVLVIDKSGSMAYPVAGARTTQQQLANEAAALAIESLAARSLIGVVAFDHDAQVVVPLQPNDDPQAIADAVRRIRPQGGTDIASGLAAADRLLRDAAPDRPTTNRGDAPRRSPPLEKRVVLLTDGHSRRGPIDQAVEGLIAQGATLTTIAVGDDTDEGLLREIAQRGGGRFYPVRNPQTLPRVLVDSVQIMNRSLLRETPFVPLPQPTGSRFQSLLSGAPALGGLVLTARREEPTAIVEWVAPQALDEDRTVDEPVLAHWSAGLGRVVAFTSSIDGPWASQWLEWNGWSLLWSDLVRLAARPALGAGLALETSLDDDRLTIEVTVEDPGDSLSPLDDSALLDPASLAATATIFGPAGRPTNVPLRRSGPRSFSAQTRLAAPGAFVLAVSPTSAGRPLAPLVTGLTRPHGAEFRRLQSDVRLLREIAESTGGRLLDADEFGARSLFDRSGMAPVRSQRGIWPWLVWAALMVFLADAAVRRIAWSPERIRKALDTAAETARNRGAAGAATVARLRQATQGGSRSGAAAEGHGRQRSRPQRSAGSDSLRAPPGAGPVVDARSHPAELQQALDALRGNLPAEGSAPSTRPAGSDEAPQDDATPDEPQANLPSASLLEAKRRASERFKK